MSCDSIYAVKKYRQFIWGSHFTIYSDHNPLQYIMKIKNPNGRLVRWSLLLMEYDFDVVYKSGKSHQNVDTLSRYPIEKPDSDDDEFPVYLNETIDMEKEQLNDEWCKTIIDAIKSGTTKKSYKKYKIENGILYRISYDHNRIQRKLICLPKKFRREILEELHDSENAGAHLGFLKTYIKVKSRFFWKNCEKSIRKYVSNCRSCQLNKPDNQAQKGLMQPIQSTEPPRSLAWIYSVQ